MCQSFDEMPRWRQARVYQEELDFADRYGGVWPFRAEGTKEFLLFEYRKLSREELEALRDEFRKDGEDAEAALALVEQVLKEKVEAGEMV